MMQCATYVPDHAQHVQLNTLFSPGAVFQAYHLKAKEYEGW